MAYAELNTGKIIGAKEGTKTYYHEEAHLKYEETKKGKIIRELQEGSFKLLIPFIVFAIVIPNNYFNYLIIFLLFLNIISELFEEVECWIYSYKKLNEKKEVREQV